MATIHEAAVQGTLLSRNKLDKFRQPAGAGFDIDQLDAKGRTPLGYGAWKGHVGVVKLLVNEGAYVNKLGKGDRSALWYATAGSMPRQNRLEVIKFLLDKKAEVDEQSSDGYTPLMKIIIDQRDPEIISILVDHGATTTIRKDGTSGPNAIDFAERTKDPKVIGALKPKAERTASTVETVSMIVGVLRFILAAVNSPWITDIANGVAKQLYQISGEDSPEIRNALQSQGPQTAEEFKKDINEYATKSGLADYFPEGNNFLQGVAEKALALKKDPSNPLRTDQDIRDLTRLALYKPVIYCDDSTSMEGTRAEDQRELVRRIARIATRLVPDGYGASLQFINYERELDDNLSADEVEEIVAEVAPNGWTEIGTNLKRKILDPLVYDVVGRGSKLKRPILISTITDGSPTDEDWSTENKDTLKKTILDCRRFLESNKYKHTAVRFQISQIGDGDDAEKFLKTLGGDPKLKEVLYCTSQRLDREYKKLRENDEDLERWLLKVLLSPITTKSVA